MATRNRETSQDDEEHVGVKAQDGRAKPPSLGRQSSIIIPSMIPTQEVLENLTQYRSGSYTDDHTWEEEERITPGQRIDHDKESSLSISNGSMTTYEDMSSILPSPLQFSGLETQPFLSTTSTARVEPPVKGEQKRAPLPKPTLPSSVATTVRKKNAGRKSVARKKKNQKTETNDEDLDPIADFDSDDSENGGNSNMDRDEDNESGSHAGRISRPTVRAPSPPPHPPKTGDGSLRSPSRRFILPTSATTTSHSGIRGQQGNPPDSPSSRKLRPVSEIPKPILPTALQAQQWPGSPKRRGGNSDLGSPPRKSATDKHVMTSNGPIRQPPLPTAIGTKSPAEKRVFMRTKSITDLGRSLINALPPAPLGPQLLKIAKEYERDTDQERKRRRLEEGKATDHETDKTKPSQAKEKGAAEPPPSSLPAAADLIKRVLLSKPSPLLESKAPKAPSVPMSPTRIKQEPLTQRRVPVQDTPRMEHPESPPLPAEIPLPALIIEYASKLTPIDQIKWPPAKTGQFHVFALVISIGPEEEIITKAGQGTAKRSISICDQSATSFKLDLWRERCQWADHFKTGDVVLISDVQTKEYRQKVTGNTSGWSKYCRLDGSVLASYRGHPTLETFLKVFIEKRRILGLDLMDKDKGIFRNPSLYMTLSLGAGPTAGAIDTEPGEPPAQGRKPLHPQRAFVPMLPSSLTGTSIRASVVYRMLKAAGDESQGWEVGACTSKGRFIKVHCHSTAEWISNAVPGRLFHFFGELEDKSGIFKIDSTSREPYSLSDDAWNAAVKTLEARRFGSIRSLRQHKYMGDATLDAYILAVSVPDLISDNGGRERDMDGFIQCYCTGCQSAAVSSPQNPSILFCPFCHLDPQRSHHSLEWMYPGFKLSLGDKPRLAANLSSEELQIQCQHEIGDQVFASVPARMWMQSDEGFNKSKMRWKRLVKLMNSGSRPSDRDEDMDTDREEVAAIEMPQKLRVEVRVGVNLMSKALKVDYL